jgi:hypothetical protein
MLAGVLARQSSLGDDPTASAGIMVDSETLSSAEEESLLRSVRGEEEEVEEVVVEEEEDREAGEEGGTEEENKIEGAANTRRMNGRPRADSMLMPTVGIMARVTYEHHRQLMPVTISHMGDYATATCLAPLMPHHLLWPKLRTQLGSSYAAAPDSIRGNRGEPRKRVNQERDDETTA